MATQKEISAVILGGHFLSLGAARNLAQEGVPVYVVDEEICISQFSRRIRHFFKSPSPKDELRFVSYLIDLATKEHLEGAVLFPSTDQTVKVLAQYVDELCPYYRITTPPWSVIHLLYDKRLSHRMAVQQNVPTPATLYPGRTDELSGDLKFPLVLKPAITSNYVPIAKKKAHLVWDLTELKTVFDSMAAIIDPSEILIQELIPGRSANLYSYFGFFKNGRPVAGFSAKRWRQHPMDFGRASTFVETMRIPELEALSVQLLTGIDYSGLAEVEFMFNPNHNRFEFLEVNPRIWGWHSIAAAAGVNLPYLAYADAIGQQTPVGEFREGVRWVRLITDIPTALKEIRKGNMSVLDYLRSVASVRTISVLSLRDPLPSIMEVLLLPYYAKHRGF